MDHENIISYIYGNFTCTRKHNIYANPDRYDNDMHEGLLDPRYFFLFGNIKKRLKGNSR